MERRDLAVTSLKYRPYPVSATLMLSVLSSYTHVIALMRQISEDALTQV